MTDTFVPEEPEEPEADITLLDNGDMEIVLPEDIEPLLEGEGVASSDIFDENLAEYLEDDLLQTIAQEAIDGYESDKNSRTDWEEQLKYGLNYLGIKVEETSDPFPGACNATHPLILEAAVKYQSKAIQELFPASGPVKTRILGNITPEKESQAQRVKNFMNYQLLEQMPEYYDDTERMLFAQAIIGSAFRKTYYDPMLGRPVSEYIPIDEFVISNDETSLTFAKRYTHVLKYSGATVRSLQARGIYRDIELAEPAQSSVGEIQDKLNKLGGFETLSAADPVHEVLEQHCYLELPKEVETRADQYDIELPYVVTVDKNSNKVLSIYRNWDENDVYKNKLEWFTHRKFVPGFNFYGYGLISLVGNLTASATAALRSLVDAGQFVTLPAGFKARGVKIVGDNGPIEPGEFRDVEATGMDLTKSIVPLPYREPSQTLLALLQFMDERGQRFADTTEQVLAESQNVGPVGTTLALLEAAAKFFAATHKRNHKAQRDEFRILSRINADNLPEEYPYEVPGEDRRIKALDFDARIDILPVSDPNIPSQAHRLSMAQAQFEIAKQTPQLHDMKEAVRRVYSAMGVEDIDKLMPPPQQAFSGDPVMENMRVMTGASVQANEMQDHDAHIMVHTAFLEDPQFLQNTIGQAQAPVMAAHIKEHMALKYKKQMESVLGTRITGQQLPPNIQIPLSQAEAEAGQQIKAAAEASLVTDTEKAAIVSQQNRDQLDREKFEFDKLSTAAELALKDNEQNLRELDIFLKASQADDTLDLQAATAKLRANTAIIKDTLDLITARENRKANTVENEKNRKAKNQ